MHYLEEQIVYDQEFSSTHCTIIKKTSRLVLLIQIIYSENHANSINKIIWAKCRIYLGGIHRYCWVDKD
jgi:hypothetical protein